MRATPAAAIDGMIATTVEAMYALARRTGSSRSPTPTATRRSCTSRTSRPGAMIESVVRRAKKLALKRYIGGRRQGRDDSTTCSCAVREEFKENEDLPNTTNPDDWAKIAGKKGERIVYVKPLMGETKEKQRSVEQIVNTGQYL